jgi:high affinity Mn2+ porin
MALACRGPNGEAAEMALLNDRARDTLILAGVAALIGQWPMHARAQSSPPEEAWAIHGQATFTDQYHPAFSADYNGPESLDPGSRGDETFDADLYAGVRPWSGAELWLNPEIDQGFGLSNTLGIAAFPSAEAYKVGSAAPYVRVPRLFLRQTIALGGAAQTTGADLYTLAGTTTADRLVFTLGKFGVPDVFDTNAYAHDPRQDFMNWAMVDTGSFDYAADAWGFSYGAAAEWYQDWWALRAGAFALSRVPNSKALDTGGGQDQYVAEAEERHTLWGRHGTLKLLGFVTRGRMGDYLDAVALADQTGGPANIAAVRKYRSRAGIALNLEQAIDDDLGFFMRAGDSEGGREAYEFTDIDKSFAVGLSLKGTRWGRPDDTIGLATVIDDISRRARDFLADGGLGILVGDGKLANSAPEQVLETYYSYAVRSYLHLTADYQFVDNPAYDRDRGPVSILGARLHFQY